MFLEITQQAAERDGGRQSGEIDEDNGGDTLHVQGVLQIADVLRVAPADVVDQSSERDSGALQRVHLLVGLLLLLRTHLGCRVSE